MIVGTVRELWRYPVKSMRGERQASLLLDRRGALGDRLYAVRDEAGKFGSGKTTRRFRRMDGLLRYRAVYTGDLPLITFPDGAALRGDDPAIHAALSARLGFPVTLEREARISHLDAGPLHLVTTTSLRTLGASLAAGTLDARRCRPNIVIELVESGAGGYPEDTWQDRELSVGTNVRLHIAGRTERCVMVGMAQDELPADPHILKAIVRENAAGLGVYAGVISPGVIHVGDHITLL